MCVEALLAMLQKAVEQQVIHGMKVALFAPMISHLFFFVDDNIIFARANYEEISHIARILETYEEASRQRINLNKSKLM